jgi:hypothetical protein
MVRSVKFIMMNYERTTCHLHYKTIESNYGPKHATMKPISGCDFVR